MFSYLFVRSFSTAGGRTKIVSKKQKWLAIVIKFDTER